MTAPRRLPERVAALLDRAAAKYGVVPELVRAIAWIESRGDQDARGTSGELGVMQLMPGTARDLKVDPTVLDQNIDGGARYIASQVKRFGLERGIAAYNAGPKYGPLPPERWPQSTQRYVQLVRARMELEAAFVQQDGAPDTGGPFASDATEATQPQRRQSRLSSAPPPSLTQSHGRKGSGEDDT